MAKQKIVIDTSAIFAFLRKESGGEKVLDLLPTSLVSVVNIAELVQLGIRHGRNPDEDIALLEMTGTMIVNADLDTARIAGNLEKSTRQFRISLADRFCLALAMQNELPVLTADRPWAELDIPLEIRLIR